MRPYITEIRPYTSFHIIAAKLVQGPEETRWIMGKVSKYFPPNGLAKAVGHEIYLPYDAVCASNM